MTATINRTPRKPRTTDAAALAAEQHRANREAYLERLEMERYTVTGITRAEYVELLRYEKKFSCKVA